MLSWPIQLAILPAIYAWGVFLEWALHRYLFHGIGKSRDSRLSFHFHDHHRACRQHDGGDPAFEASIFSWNAYGREALGLTLLCVLHLPMVLVMPISYLGIIAFGVNYHRVHRRCHIDTEWGWKHAPWHMAHHMNRGDKNWCVTTDWLDRLVGTAQPLERRKNVRSNVQSNV